MRPGRLRFARPKMARLKFKYALNMLQGSFLPLSQFYFDLLRADARIFTTDHAGFGGFLFTNTGKVSTDLTELSRIYDAGAGRYSHIACRAQALGAHRPILDR